MVEQYFYPILIALILMIFVLAAFSGRLWAKIQVSQDRNEEIKNNELKRLLGIKKSLVVIAKGVVDGRCEPAEGCIRLAKLINRFGLIDKADQQLALLFEMYEKVADFKYLDARKNLSKQQTFNEDKARIKIENDYSERLKEVSSSLLIMLEDIKLEAS